MADRPQTGRVDLSRLRVPVPAPQGPPPGRARLPTSPVPPPPEPVEAVRGPYCARSWMEQHEARQLAQRRAAMDARRAREGLKPLGGAGNGICVQHVEDDPTVLMLLRAFPGSEVVRTRDLT